MDFLKGRNAWIVSFALALCVYTGYALTLAPPGDFPAGKVVIIARGTGVPEIVQQLSDTHIVAHSLILRLLLRVSSHGTSVPAGAYRFERPQNALTIAYRLSTGAYDIPSTRITFVEGTTVREAASLIADAVPGITVSDFTAAAKQYEGYLFPDTYTFPPGSDADSIVTAMRANFNAKMAILSDQVNASGHSLSNIVIMASLVEKEARTSEVRKTIAGILYNRLRLGMPLQVDAVFGYIYNRDTYSPSFSDLKTESPYNLYLHTGLPPGPIDNPGLDSLEAALNPTKTNYLYYLTDKNGVMHYATTYAGHVVNQNKFLR